MSERTEQDPRILVGHVTGDAEELPEGVIHHVARDPDDPHRVDRRPVVIEDLAQIEATRRRFETDLGERYQQALDVVRDGRYVFSEHTFALKWRREQAVRDLCGMLDDPDLSAAGKALAAEQLIALEDDAGEQYLFDSLTSSSPAQVRAALKKLGHWGPKPDFSIGTRTDEILRLLEDEDEQIAAAAARVCVYHELSGAEQPLARRLRSGNLSDPKPLAQALIQRATTRESAELALPYVLQRDSSGGYSQAVDYYLYDVLNHEDHELAEYVRQQFLDFVLSFEDLRHDQSVVRDLKGIADERTIPVLEEITANADDPVSRWYAVEGLARLQPEQAVPLLLELIEEEGPHGDLIRQLSAHVQPSDFERVESVVRTALAERGSLVETSVCQLFLQHFGEQGESFLRDLQGQLDDDARMWTKWRLEGINVRTALEELVAAGVIKTSVDEVLEQMQSDPNREQERQLDLADPHLLTIALSSAWIVTMFDAETGTIPCDHDRLVYTFAEFSGGDFDPECVVQTWHATSEEDFNAPYTLELVYEGRLFRCGVENFGDWYDVEAVVGLLNFALETTGRSERYIGLGEMGQIAVFVFADPLRLLPIAQKYALPLSSDNSSAMRAGIEFERRALGE